MIEDWVKEKGFSTYGPPPLKPFVNIWSKQTDLALTVWPCPNGNVKFILHRLGLLIREEDLHPACPEFLSKAEKILSWLTQKN